MKIYLIPKSNLGKWSVGLIVAMPLLFCLGSSFTETIYKSVPAGSTIPGDIIQRPLLALAMLMGMVSGISAFISGFMAITKKKERAIIVYFSTLIGLLLLIFLVAEILFPH